MHFYNHKSQTLATQKSGKRKEKVTIYTYFHNENLKDCKDVCTQGSHLISDSKCDIGNITCRLPIRATK